jgi:RNA polymerase sigma-70 factor (ECF subfamily)
MPPSDPELKRTRFEAEALPFMRALYGGALHLAHDSDEAGDLVQETFLRAYRTFDTFRPGTNCRAWLFTILYTVFINRRKKLRREVGPFSADELDALYPQYLEGPSASDEQLAPDVERALAALPEPFRLAVLLVDVQELSHEQAAAALECPVATLRTRLFRARRLLYVALREHGRRAGYLTEEGR